MKIINQEKRQVSHVMTVCHSDSRAHRIFALHYSDVTMSAMGSQITSFTIVDSTVYLGVDQRKHQLCVTGLCVGNSPVNSPHKGPVTRQMSPFDDVIMSRCCVISRVFLSYNSKNNRSVNIFYQLSVHKERFNATFDLLFKTVSAGELVILGAKTSARTVIAKFMFRIGTGSVL